MPRGSVSLSQWDKLIEDILSKSPGLRFDDLAKALMRIGYTQNQSKGGGSHYTFRKKGCMPITIPKHGPLKRAYIELVAEAVRIYMEEAEHD